MRRGGATTSALDEGVARGFLSERARRPGATRSFAVVGAPFPTTVDYFVFHHRAPKGTITRVAVNITFGGSLGGDVTITSTPERSGSLDALYTFGGHRDGTPIREVIPPDLGNELVAFAQRCGGVLSIWEGGVRWEQSPAQLLQLPDACHRCGAIATWAWRDLGSADPAIRAKAPSPLAGPHVLPLRNQIGLVFVLFVLMLGVAIPLYFASGIGAAIAVTIVFAIPLAVLIPFTIWRAARER